MKCSLPAGLQYKSLFPSKMTKRCTLSPPCCIIVIFFALPPTGCKWNLLDGHFRGTQKWTKSLSKHSNTKPLTAHLINDMSTVARILQGLWSLVRLVVASSSMLWPQFGSRGVNGPDVPVNKELLARFMLAEAKYGNGCFAMLTVSSYKRRNTLIWLVRMLLCADCGPSAEGATATFFCCSSKRCC